MPVVPFLPLIASGVSALVSSNASNNAKTDLANAANASQLNTQNIENQALSLGQQNAAASQALQQQYQPWAIPLQSGANTAVLGQLGNTAGVNAGQQLLTNNLTTPLNTPVGNAAVTAAGQQLALGGQLGQGTQNAVAQAALQQAGGVTQGGLGIGRNLTAQDLGLTSLALQQQRIGQATTAGGLEQSTAAINAQNVLNRIQALSGIQQNSFQRAATGAQIGNSIQAPATGINPGSAGNIAASNAGNLSNYYTNLAGIQGQTGINGSSSVGGLGSIFQGLSNSGAFSNLFGGSQSPSIGNGMTAAQMLAN